MAIIIKTERPYTLLRAIRKAIDDSDVVTWSYDEAGDFTHWPTQWRNKAWLRPEVRNQELCFSIWGREDEDMTKLIYGIYHGRFIEMILTHFDNKFTLVYSTAQKSELDNF